MIVKGKSELFRKLIFREEYLRLHAPVLSAVQWIVIGMLSYSVAITLVR